MSKLRDFLITIRHASTDPRVLESIAADAGELLAQLDAAAKDGGPAYPQNETRRFNGAAGWRQEHLRGGMSLRDWFAGQALCGLLAGRQTTLKDYERDVAGDLANASYAVADAMLSERKQREESET